MANQATVLNRAGGRIVCRFHARDVHLVMGPPRQESAVRFRVSMDGQPPGPARGLDVDDSGSGTVREQRLYQLIRQPGPIVDRIFEINSSIPASRHSHSRSANVNVSVLGDPPGNSDHRPARRRACRVLEHQT